MSLLNVGVVQATPVLFDLEQSLRKAEDLIHTHGSGDCDFLLFPEAFLPGYPRGLDFGTVVGSRTNQGREQWATYYESSIEVPGDHTEALGKMAKAANVFLAIGVSERDQVNGSLYCTLLYFSPEGKLLGKHRKIKPTGSERIIWGEGQGDSLVTIDTEFGVVGGLICWENYMPAARMAMYNKGIDLYLAPTADSRDTWLSSLIHIACEGRCFVLGCNQYVMGKDYPEKFHSEKIQPETTMCRGASVIISPLGELIEGPLLNQEGVLKAQLDSRDLARARLDFDVTGHYSRPDIFSFAVKDQPGTISIK